VAGQTVPATFESVGLVLDLVQVSPGTSLYQKATCGRSPRHPAGTFRLCLVLRLSIGAAVDLGRSPRQDLAREEWHVACERRLQDLIVDAMVDVRHQDRVGADVFSRPRWQRHAQLVRQFGRRVADPLMTALPASRGSRSDARQLCRGRRSRLRGRQHRAGRRPSCPPA
jgi:hypothetical protein